MCISSNSSRANLASLSLALVGWALGGCGANPEPIHKESDGETVRVETAKAQVIKMDRGTDVTGTVRAEFNAILTAKATGRVLQVFVREGDFVTKGQLLIQIEDADLAAASKSASSNLANSSASVKEAEQALSMERKSAEAQIAEASAALSQAKAARAAAKARLDLVLAGPRKQEVDQANIAVQQAQSDLNLAQSEYNRTKYLVDEGALAKRELEIARNQLEQAQARLKSAQRAQSMAVEGSREQDIRQAKEALAQADGNVKAAEAAVQSARARAMQVGIRQTNIDQAVTRRAMAAAQVEAANVQRSYTRITAPFAGRVSARNVDQGSFASPGSPLLTIEGGEFLLEASVPERSISYVNKGDEAQVQLDAIPKSSFHAVVKEITPQGDSLAHSFKVKYRLDADPKIKSGMFGRTRVAMTSHSVLAIPQSAIIDREGLQQVFVIDDEGVARMRVVTLGAEQGGSVEVLSGLTPGLKVATSKVKSLTDGQRVN